MTVSRPGAATLAALLGLAAAACFPKGWPPERPGFGIRDFPYDAGPWLVRTSPTEMAVVVMHDLPSPPTVQWWVRPEEGDTSPVARTQVVAERRDDLWIARMADLPSDRVLRYALESDLGLLGPIDFVAHRSRERPFRFAALGDTRNGHDVHRVLIERLAREGVDFYINSGDLVEFGGQLDRWIRFFNIEAPLISGSPLFAAVGNHDNSQRLNFRRLFLTRDYARGERYFAQDWGDVRIVILDSEIEMREGSAQHDFMERVLRDGADRDMIMVLSMHYPPYSSGEHGSNPEVRAAVAPLVEKHGVELVLSGHDHDYERTKPIGGATYLVAASGGAPIRSVLPRDFTEVFRTEPHYVVFDVEAGRLVGQAINLEGEVFDTFIIEPNPPRSQE